MARSIYSNAKSREKKGDPHTEELQIFCLFVCFVRGINIVLNRGGNLSKVHN